MVCLLSIAACQGRPAQPAADAPAAAADSASPPQQVEVSDVRREAVSKTISLPVSIEGFREAPLQTKIDAFVEAVLVDIGDHVKAGQLLIRLSAPELEFKAAERAGMVSQITAELEVRTAELRAARSNLAQQEATITLRDSELERTQRLVGRGSLTQQKLAEARLASESAQALLAAERDRVVVAEARLAMTEKQLDVARAAAKQADAIVQYLKIRAPFTGVVTQRSVDPGELVRPSGQDDMTPLLTVTQIDKLRGVVYATMEVAAQLDAGDPAVLDVVDLPGHVFPVTLARTSGAFDPQSRMMRAEIDVDNPTSVRTGKLLLKPGSYGTLRVTLNQQDLPAVKPSAIKRDNGQTAVMLVTPEGVCLETPIKIALEGDHWVGIASGLSPGARVVSRDPGGVSHETQLQPELIRQIE